MPVHKVPGRGYRWGHAKTYWPTKAGAAKQGKAIWARRRASKAGKPAKSRSQVPEYQLPIIAASRSFHGTPDELQSVAGEAARLMAHGKVVASPASMQFGGLAGRQQVLRRIVAPAVIRKSSQRAQNLGVPSQVKATVGLNVVSKDPRVNGYFYVPKPKASKVRIEVFGTPQTSLKAFKAALAHELTHFRDYTGKGSSKSYGSEWKAYSYQFAIDPYHKSTWTKEGHQRGGTKIAKYIEHSALLNQLDYEQQQDPKVLAWRRAFEAKYPNSSDTKDRKG